MAEIARSVFNLGLWIAGFLSAGAVGLAVFVFINWLPALAWGDEVLIATPYLTIPVGGLIGVVVFAMTMKKVTPWLTRGWPAAAAQPAAGHAVFASTVVVAAAAGWFAYLHPHTVVVAWNEEVALSDGARVSVRRKEHHYKEGWTGSLKNRPAEASELVFTPGPGSAPVAIRTRLNLYCLERIGHDWYLVAAGPGELPEWGRSLNRKGQRIARLQGNKLVPVPWSEAPAQIQISNLLDRQILSAAEQVEKRQFHVTLEDKQQLSAAFAAKQSRLAPKVDRDLIPR